MAGSSEVPPAAEEGPVINDAIADRLMRSLDEMEEDYKRTIAAERKEPDEPLNLRALAMEEVGAHNGQVKDGEDEEGEESAESELGALECGYGRIGSDDEGDSDDDAGTASNANQAGFQVLGDEAWASPEDGDVADFEAFQQGGALESFADFRATNPALPTPPKGMTAFEATPLADEDVVLIKNAMKKIEITPPLWASALTDEALERRVQQAMREV